MEWNWDVSVSDTPRSVSLEIFLEQTVLNIFKDQVTEPEKWYNGDYNDDNGWHLFALYPVLSNSCSTYNTLRDRSEGKVQEG